MLTAYTDAILDLRQGVLGEGCAKSQSDSGSILHRNVLTLKQRIDLDPLPSLVGDMNVARYGTQLVRAGTIATVTRGWKRPDRYFLGSPMSSQVQSWPLSVTSRSVCSGAVFLRSWPL